MKKWNDDVFDNIVDQKKFIFEKLLCFDEKEAVGVLSVVEKERKLGFAAELEKILLWRRFLGDKNLRPFG